MTGYAKNPVPLSSKAEIEQAAALYESFTGHDALNVVKISHEFPKTCLQVGLCDGILYSTTRDGVPEKYIHRFKKSARPIFGVSSDGTQLVLIGGKFQFTEAGITDH